MAMRVCVCVGETSKYLLMDIVLSQLVVSYYLFIDLLSKQLSESVFAWYVSMYVCDYGLQIDCQGSSHVCVLNGFIYLFTRVDGLIYLFIYCIVHADYLFID